MEEATREALFRAVAKDDAVTLASILKADPSYAKAYVYDGWTLVHEAAKHNSVRSIGVLRRYGAFFNTPTVYGRTRPIAVARDFGNTEAALQILNALRDERQIKRAIRGARRNLIERILRKRTVEFTKVVAREMARGLLPFKRGPSTQKQQRGRLTA